MELVNFLESSDREKLKIVSMLEEETAKRVPFEKFVLTLGISRFKINNYIKQINEDLEQYNIQINIIYQPFLELEAKNLTIEIVRKIRLFYLKRSAIFEMFSDLMVSKLSINEFGKKRFFSRSKTYVIKKNLEQLLSVAGLHISNKELVGDEQTIRKFAFEVYYYFFNGLEFPFPESIRKEVKAANDILMSEVKIESVPTRLTKLELFMALSILRIKNKRVVGKSLVELSSYRETVFGKSTNFYKAIEEHYFLTASERNRELDFLLVFLITEDILLTDVFSIGIANQKIKSLTTEMQNMLLAELPLPKGVPTYEKEAILAKMTQSLFKLHFKLVYFSVTYFTSNTQQQLPFFVETYPKFHHLVEKFLNFLFSADQFPQLHNKRLALYYDYMLSLISSVPMKYLKNKVHICVDFSKGEIYTDYIVNNLEFFGNLNIEVQRKLTNDTDVYLSDYYYNKALCEQVIWKNTPTDEDWRYLGKVIAEIRKQLGT